MYNFTLIIPTHNRQEYLKRSIDYFKDLDAQVIYCDSTELKSSEKFSSNMLYIHLPNEKFVDKILIALDLIKTDYIALCADDDFVIIDALYEGASVLSHSESIKTVLGFNLLFHENFDKNFYYRKKSKFFIIDSNPYDNIKLFFNNYQQVLWGMYDKTILKKSFDIIKQAEFKNDNFIELVIGGIACYIGGISILKRIWSVRELSHKIHWGNRQPSISSIYFNRNFKSDFISFKIKIDENTEDGYSTKILENYLKFSSYQRFKMRIKNSIKKIIGKKLNSEPNKKEFKDSFEKYPDLYILNGTPEQNLELKKISEVLINNSHLF